MEKLTVLDLWNHEVHVYDWNPEWDDMESNDDILNSLGLNADMCFIMTQDYELKIYYNNKLINEIP